MNWPSRSRPTARFSPNTPSNLLLDKPVNGPLSSKFGVRRFFNGEERNPHAGLDFAVPAGTPIKTPAAGKVISDRQLLLQRQYGVCRPWPGLHQHVLPHVENRREGRPADWRVAVVGKVGATGRATGPHMHWNVSLNDARVDPAIFIGAFQP